MILSSFIVISILKQSEIPEQEFISFLTYHKHHWESILVVLIFLMVQEKEQK